MQIMVDMRRMKGIECCLVETEVICRKAMATKPDKNSSKSSKSGEEEKVNVMVTLKGDEARRFLAYKREQLLRDSAAACYKLMFERLAQIEKEEMSESAA